MNIKNENINLTNIQSVPKNIKKTEKPEVVSTNNSFLPSVYVIGQSQINSNLPVSYKVIGEISVPGLKDKAKIYKLANGQRVIIASKKGPAVIRTTYNVGAMNEPDNIRGMSHFIEHNLFNGSKNLVPKEYDQKVSELGGSTNASTGFAATDYYLSLQLLNDNSLEEAIKLNAEQTQFPIFPIEQLIKEKEPVKSEIDMCNDDADTVAVCKMLKNLFNIQSSSPDFVIGTKENINSFTRDKVIDYFNTWYTPDNALTVITGDVDIDETINIAAKYFNKQNDYSHINKRYYDSVKYTDKPVREDIIQSNTTQPSAVIGFVIPEGTNQNELNKIDTLFSLLNSSSSNLSKSLDKLGASIDFSIENMQNKPQGAKAIIIKSFAPEDKIEDTIKTIYSEITNIQNNPPYLTEINNVKKCLTNNILSSSESSSQLNIILTNAALTNSYDCFNSSINDINNIMPEDISETAKKYFDLNKVSICVSHERNITPQIVEKNYKKNKQISFGAKNNPVDNLKEEAAKIQSTNLQNNIQSTVIPGNSNAKSCIRINLNTDELNEITNAEFIILNEMLNRGSIIRGADNFNNILNSLDISLTLKSDTDGISLISEFNDNNIQNSMQLIKENLLYPNFTQEEFIRAKQLTKESIKSEAISGENKLFHELLPQLKKYNEKETRLNELEKLTLNDIKSLYSKIFSLSSCQALITTPIDINPGLNNIFNDELVSGMPVFKPYTHKKGDKYNIYSPNNEEKILTTEREQSQAEILQGYKFKKSDNIDDIAKINLVNFILGSSMSSRLFVDLRENQKLAYSVGSRLCQEKDTGILYLRIETTTESADNKEGSPQNITKAITGFNRNVNLLKTTTVSEKELENAKRIYKRRILDNIETNFDKSQNYLESLNSYYNTELNQKLFEAIDRVTIEDIKTASKYIFKNPPVISIAASKKTLNELNFLSV